jgi:hypothetical protein
VLLVGHGEAEPVEGDPLLDERVGSDHDLRLAGGDPGEGGRALLALDRGREELDPVGAAPQEPPQGEEVLLGQDLGGSHEGRLVAVLEHDTIPSSATIVLPEPTSPWTRRFMGCGERRSSAISRSTRFCAPVSGKGRMRFTLSRAAAVTSNGPAGAPPAAAPAAGEAELEEEELLQDEPHVARERKR